MADRDVSIDVLLRDKTLPGTRSVIRNVNNIKRQAEKATAGIGSSIAESITNALMAVAKSPPVIAAGAAIGVVLAAQIMAAMSAAILLAVGGSVIAAGIMAAANSPKVQKAWQGFTTRAKKALGDFGKPFEGPVTRALDTFANAIERMAPTLNSMGRSIAPIIDKLAPALAEMAEKALPGFQIALEASKPVFDVLAKHLPKIGEAITKMLVFISLGAPEASMALDHVLTIVEFLIIGLGAMFLFWAKTYGAIVAGWKFIKNAFIDGVKIILNTLGKVIQGAAAAFGWIPGIGPKLQEAAKEFEEFRKKVNSELEQLKDHTIYVKVRTVGGVDRVTSNTGGGRSLDDPSTKYAYGGSFAFAGGGLSRTGGPVQVNQSLSVSLDGAPFWEFTDRKISESERRTAWRAKVGRR